MSKNNHDEHYKNFEKVLGHQPITVMEAVACNGLPQAFHAQAKRNLHVAMAIKYLLRLGSKDEADKEINKAENFLYRARTGSWRPVAEALPLFAEAQDSVDSRHAHVGDPHCVGCDNDGVGTEGCAGCRSDNYSSYNTLDRRGPTVTVTTHGKQSEATEAEVGKAVAELQAAPTPTAPVQPRRKYPVVRECATCEHLGSRKECTTDGCFMYSLWEPKPEEARVVPRGCASCEDGPSPSHCRLFHERRCGDIGSSFPLWKAKA